MVPYAEFRWSEAPLASLPCVAVASISYVLLALLARSRALAKPEAAAAPPVGASHALAAHNLVLCFASLVMCVGAAYETARRVEVEGIGWFFCDQAEGAADGPLFFWAYCERPATQLPICNPRSFFNEK